jgi:hypothetical protein
MRHVALNRTWPDDGDLDHQIVKFFRPQMRQHVHLRPTLHLERADGIALAQHVVNGRVLAWDTRVDRAARSPSVLKSARLKAK